MPYIGNKYEIGDHNNSWKPLDDISSYVATFDGSATNAVSTTNNRIRVPEHRFIQGQRVTYSNGGGGNIGGLTSGTAYYIIHDTNNEFKLATSLSNANASTAINLSAVGSGTSHTVTAAFDGVNKKFKITYSGGRSSRFTSATQLTVAINNIVQRANDTATFTDGFGISDNEKIVFNVAPVAADIFWGNILSASLPTFDISDNKLDNFTGNGSATDFTLSHIPANNESIIVTVNGVVQHPTDKNGTRAYSLDASVLAFTAAPANGDEIQVRHIGFAGATTSAVTGFYGRTGNVTLSSSADDAIVGVITATKFSGPFVGTITGGNDIIAGIITATKIDLNGDIDVDGHTNLDNVSIAGVTTSTGAIDLNADLDVDGHTNLDNVSIAGVSTLTGNVTTQSDVKFANQSIDNAVNWGKVASILQVRDGSKLTLGNSNNLSIYASGTDKYIKGSTSGELVIRDDAITMQAVTSTDTYFDAVHGGSVSLFWDNSKKFETTNTGAVVTGICTATDFSGAAGGAADFPNGLTGTTATFSGNVSVGGTLTYEDVTNVDAVGIVTAREGVFIPDTKELKLGNTAASPDLKLYSTGTNGWVYTQQSGADLYMGTNAGEVYIQTGTSGNDTAIKVNSGGSVELNYGTTKKLETYSGGVAISGDASSAILRFNDTDGNVNYQIAGYDGNRMVIMDGTGGTVLDLREDGNNIFCKNSLRLDVDNLEVSLGGGTDFKITHNGSENVFDASTSNPFVFKFAGNEKVRITSGGSLKLPDNGKIELGGAQSGAGDLQIYHTAGSDSTIHHTATSGSTLRLRSRGFTFKNQANSQTIATLNEGDACKLFFNGGEKITTTGSGISVTGKVVASGEIESAQDYPNFRPTFDFNLAGVKKLDSRITYTRTGPASYIDELGIVKFVGDNTPRFDHDPLTRESRGLLIEPARTNLFASSDASNSVWILNGSITKEANTTDTKDPAGTYTACKLMSAASANSTSQIYDGLSHGSGGVQSLWVKKGTHNVLGIFDYGGGSGVRGWFDLNTGEHRCEGGSKVAAGVQSSGNDSNTTNMIEYPNGWYRCIYYEAANMTYAHFRIVDFDADNEASASSNSIYVWGLQAEGSGVTFATSHIPCNTGVMPGTVTRGGDIAYLDGTVGTEFDDIYRSDEGTFIIDWFNNPDGNHNDGYVFTVDDGTGNNRIAAVNSNNYQVTVTSGGSSQGTRDLGSINSGANKIAFTYKHNDQATSLNGSDASVDTSSALPTGVKYMWFGLRQGQYDLLGGYISRIVYYTKRLPNNQLKTLSS